jgi:hypothetical protein
MAYYLVQAKPIPDSTEKLYRILKRGDIQHMRPFGQALHEALENARVLDNGFAIWEEEDYCAPPLAQERVAVLNNFFEKLSVERVEKGRGWRQIMHLPLLWTQIQELQRDPTPA